MTTTNWNSTASCDPARVVTPRDLDHLVEIVKGADAQGACPSPVRAVGSLHSLNHCFTTTGTLVQMKSDAFRDIGEPANGSVTVGAGVTMFELKEKLNQFGLQIAVTPEIGNATAGSVACCGTKDASLQGGPGQISSTVIGARIVDASGAERPVTAAELQAFRSSYGLFGIVHQVTFETVPMQMVEYRAETLDLADLDTVDQVLDTADGRAHGFLGFLFPFDGKLVAERRTLRPGQTPTREDFRHRAARTAIWKSGAHPFAEFHELFAKGFELLFPRLHFLSPRPDVMIDFPRGGDHFFDFAFWAFPAGAWKDATTAYVTFCRDFQRDHGFRADLPTEVYYIAEDARALLSFSKTGPIFTLDMVHTVHLGPEAAADRELWRRMNLEFNEKIAMPFGARPLLNQTKELTREVVVRTLGQEWKTFAGLRQSADRDGRFLSAYFAGLLP